MLSPSQFALWITPEFTPIERDLMRRPLWTVLRDVVAAETLTHYTSENASTDSFPTYPSPPNQEMTNVL